jgi:aspartyl/asparaginyl-tRNA synthetase
MEKTILCVSDPREDVVVGDVIENLLYPEPRLFFKTDYRDSLEEAKRFLDSTKVDGVYIYDLQIPTGRGSINYNYVELGEHELSFRANAAGLELIDYCRKKGLPIVAGSAVGIERIEKMARRLGNLDAIIHFPLDMKNLRKQFIEKFAL